MPYNYAQYWKTYNDFKRDKYNLCETAKIKSYKTLGTPIWNSGFGGDLDIFWSVESCTYGTDPFIPVLNTTTSYVDFQFAVADFLLAITPLPSSNPIACTISNDGSGKILVSTTIDHLLTNSDTVRFSSTTTAPANLPTTDWEYFGVEVVTARTFRVVNLTTGVTVNYGSAGTGVGYRKNLASPRVAPFSANNIFDFNTYVVQPTNISTLYNARASINVYLPSSNRYLTLYDFRIDNMQCIVSARGEFVTSPKIY